MISDAISMVSSGSNRRPSSPSLRGSREPSLIPASAGFPASEGFKVNDTEALGLARHREQIAKIVVFGKLLVRDEAGKHHGIPHSTRSHCRRKGANAPTVFLEPST